MVFPGCSGKMEQPGEALCFDVAVQGSEWPGSKAAGEIGSLSGIHDGIGVFACNTGRYRYTDSNPLPDFMYNEKVYYSGGHWVCDIPKYWPADPEDRVSFFAYAPYSGSGADADVLACISSFSLPDQPGNPWLTYQLAPDAAHQVDLLFAQAVTDRTRPAEPTPIGFHFKHALSCVGESVTVACSDAMKTSLDSQAGSGEISVLLNDLRVTYHLTAKARLVLWNQGDANWEPLLGGEQTVSRTVDYLSGSGGDQLLYSTASGGSGWNSAGGEGIFYIPLDVAGHYQTAEVSVGYTIRRTDGLTLSETAARSSVSIQLRSYPSAFAPGKKMNLTVTLSQP